jgi:hypothetical protein
MIKVIFRLIPKQVEIYQFLSRGKDKDKEYEMVGRKSSKFRNDGHPT